MPTVTLKKTTLAENDNKVFFAGAAHVSEKEAEALKSGDASEVQADPQAEGGGSASGGNDLSSLTVTELKERAKEAGVEGYSSMNKADLVAALEAKEGAK